MPRSAGCDSENGYRERSQAMVSEGYVSPVLLGLVHVQHLELVRWGRFCVEGQLWERMQVVVREQEAMGL
ncbi:hypothetical protein TRAPUB_2257 [Trametes pubescens]|uniref:Uncharacterized protein n=1 Tax=Trametes pubescens TaxID=154538 RepID=A0A1M2VH26_TRAPU|nr:hypothetical protein TRAPUB_2257 [Trametes pubescens]